MAEKYSSLRFDNSTLNKTVIKLRKDTINVYFCNLMVGKIFNYSDQNLFVK